jgi:predicted SAM-dependent methyltransferase
MSKLLVEVDYSKPLKVEVGSGMYPQPGYFHVDVTEGMPDLGAVCKMGDEPIPLKDNSVEEILSNHSIEHVSWLKVDAVVRDWHRILKPGGRIFLRTPDLEFICKTYVEKKTTRESVLDEQAMVERFGTVGPAEWANIKLFAGQNYVGNFHYLAFDMDMLTRFLQRNGFEKIQRLKILPVFSPGEIQCEAYKK